MKKLSNDKYAFQQGVLYDIMRLRFYGFQHFTTTGHSSRLRYGWRNGAWKGFRHLCRSDGRHKRIYPWNSGSGLRWFRWSGPAGTPGYGSSADPPVFSGAQSSLDEELQFSGRLRHGAFLHHGSGSGFFQAIAGKRPGAGRPAAYFRLRIWQTPFL